MEEETTLDQPQGDDLDGGFQSIDDLRDYGKDLSTHELLRQLLYSTRQLPRARRYRAGYTEWGTKVALTPTSDAVAAANSSGFAGALVQTPVDTPDDKDDRDYVITWRLHAMPPGFGGAVPSVTCGLVQVLITYTQGQANYTIGPYPVLDTQHHTLPFTLTARKVVVSAKWFACTTIPTPSPIAFSASAGETDAEHVSLASNPPVWFSSPKVGYTGGAAQQVTNSANQAPVPSSGALAALRGAVSTVSGTAYVMVFDSPSVTAPVAEAVPLWTSDPLVQGQGFSAFAPFGASAWNYTLWVGLSSTLGAYTPVAGTFTCDVLGG